MLQKELFLRRKSGPGLRQPADIHPAAVIAGAFQLFDGQTYGTVIRAGGRIDGAVQLQAFIQKDGHIFPDAVALLCSGIMI